MKSGFLPNKNPRFWPLQRLRPYSTAWGTHRFFALKVGTAQLFENVSISLTQIKATGMQQFILSSTVLNETRSTRAYGLQHWYCYNL